MPGIAGPLHGNDIHLSFSGKCSCRGVSGVLLFGRTCREGYTHRAVTVIVRLLGLWPTVRGLFPQLEVTLLSAVCRCTPCSCKPLVASDSTCFIKDLVTWHRLCASAGHSAWQWHSLFQHAAISTRPPETDHFRTPDRPLITRAQRRVTVSFVLVMVASIGASRPDL